MKEACREIVPDSFHFKLSIDNLKKEVLLLLTSYVALDYDSE